MSTIAKSFTATGVGIGLSVHHGDSFSYTVSGTFVGTVVLERTLDGGANYSTIVTSTASASGTIAVETPNRDQATYRFNCTAYTSGTIVTSIADVNIANATFQDDTGAVAFQRTEDGLIVKNLTVTGTSTGTAAGGFAAGSSSTPSINFATDTDTGFYLNTANTIAAAAGSTNIFTASDSLFKVFVASQMTNLTLSTTASGSTPTALDYYEEGSFTAVFNLNAGSGGSNNSFTVKFIRIGKLVTLSFPAMNGVTTGGVSSSAMSTATSTIPTRILPTRNQYGSVVTSISGGTNAVGAYNVHLDGSIDIYRENTLATAWPTSSANNGANAFSVTYTIN